MQFVTFATMFVSGALLGIIFDTYRVVSRPFKWSRLTFSLFDIIYWIIATVVVFGVLFVSNDGELRFFIFIGLLLGTWFYFSLVSSYMIVSIKHCMRWIKKMVDFLWRCFNNIIIKPIKMVYRLLVFLGGICAAVTIFIYKLVIQCLKWMKQLYIRLFKR